MIYTKKFVPRLNNDVIVPLDEKRLFCTCPICKNEVHLDTDKLDFVNKKPVKYFLKCSFYCDECLNRLLLQEKKRGKKK